MPPPAFVQQTPKASASNLSSVVALFGSPTASGNLIVALAAAYASAGDVAITVFDNKANPYLQAVEGFQTANTNGAIEYAKDIAGGANHDVTFQAGSNCYWEVNAVEVSGADTVDPLDQTGLGTGSSTSASASTPATTDPNEIVFACMSAGGNLSAAGIEDPAATGYTSIGVHQNAASTQGYQSSYKTVTATGAQSASWDISGGTMAWVAMVATFKEAGVGPTKVANERHVLSHVGGM